MRCAALASILLAHLASVSGCDLVFARTTTTRWLCKSALMGLVVHEHGGEIEAGLFLFDDAVHMPDPKEVGAEEEIGGLPLAAGIVDSETRTLVFPLQTNTLVQANAATLLRANGASYAEFPLEFSKPTLEARWRDGASSPKHTRTFERCGK